MAKILTIRVPAPARRDSAALAAKMRHGGAMKHKNTPRGGQRNEQRDLLDELQDDEQQALCKFCAEFHATQRNEVCPSCGTFVP